MRCLTAILVLASHLQLDKRLLFDPLALGPTSGHDDQSITTSGSLKSGNWDQACSQDLMPLREQTSTTVSKRSAKISSHVRNTSGLEAGYSLSVSERSLLTDLATTGFRLVWDYMDITYASYIAFHQTTELWANITANARGKWKAEKEVMALDISYGGLKLSIAGLIDAISWELVAEFAAKMLILSRIVIFGVFRLIIFAHWEALVITLAIAVQVLGTFKPQQVITGP
ncbi:MAG: hypothetical protein ALECFALPRED_003315 [Alectoria fallacina]|uniref:Uncharacterized protein n=1 Tax=Alectoria fallacina TaxID=1903189 RepID=A0A8H3ER33_9LECA|nr:MAG: hypothetical protein ALECFALPRED_003315 [Alectoria fallacina]